MESTIPSIRPKNPLPYPCLFAVLRRYSLDHRRALLKAIPGIRRDERTVGYEFGTVSFEFTRRTKETGLKFDDECWTIKTMKKNEPILVRCPNGEEVTSPLTLDVEGVEILIDYYLGRRCTSIETFRCKEIFPISALNKCPDRINNLELNTWITEPSEEFLDLLRARNQYRDVKLINSKPKSAIFDLLSGISMEKLEVHTGFLDSPDSLLDANVNRLEVFEDATTTWQRKSIEESKLLDRFFAFARKLRDDSCRLEKGSFYRLQQTSTVGWQLHIEGKLKERVLALLADGERLPKARGGHLFCLDVSEGTRLAIGVNDEGDTFSIYTKLF